MPPRFTRDGHLIRLDQLDVPGAAPLLAIGFRMPDDRDELWTQRFNQVKSADPNAVQKAAQVLSAGAGSLSWSGAPLVVVGAISSEKRAIDADDPVWKLGTAVASAVGGSWDPTLLQKEPHDSLSRMEGRGWDRDAEVDGVYEARNMKSERGTFIVVDDFCTRGATLSDIRRALLEANPSWQCRSLVLGKNEKRNFWGESLTNDHIPEVLSQAWEGG